MTQRSIPVGAARTIIIKAGGSVSVRGQEGSQVTAETQGRWGLSLERRSPAQIARARAVVGETVLFDLRLKLPALKDKAEPDDAIEIQIGGSGEVRVPFSSNLKIYAGKDIEVVDIRGQVDAYAGWNLSLHSIDRLGNASAGASMNLDCQSFIGADVTYTAGSDLRFHATDLTSARLRVKDLGGYWEARIGAGEKTIYLKSGGDVTFVTDQTVEALPPNYILGKIETPLP